ncbi:uncharacterized protein SOCE836_097810 [Sorangium cellulosum]|uniref:Secreted protein n=1 Tax=Sorangium cellulosum TaxID=56 RepID=A0A4P2R3B9_SORCE|nr:uncharacterized protein SOCE836_097810 [Sorangium cellulosum]WCQ96843.1 hypothetical protein NQZ70_09632 [Sorangium sp. Soce836]
MRTVLAGVLMGFAALGCAGCAAAPPETSAAAAEVAPAPRRHRGAARARHP